MDDKNSDAVTTSFGIGAAVIRWMDDDFDAVTTSVGIGHAVKIPQHTSKGKHKRWT